MNEVTLHLRRTSLHNLIHVFRSVTLFSTACFEAKTLFYMKRIFQIFKKILLNIMELEIKTAT